MSAPLSERWDHFDDNWAFDENWRQWIDNPPVGWRPPEKTPLFWHVIDHSDKDGWIMRLDAWIGAEGLHMHFRWVVLLAVPDKRDLDAWVEAGSPPDKVPPPVWTFSKKAVAGFVIPWPSMGFFEDTLVDPDKGDDNGKGEDLTDYDKGEL